MSEGLFGHVADAVMLAAEAGEHLLLAQGHLAAATAEAGIAGTMHGAGYVLDAIGAPGGESAVTHHTAAGLHADGEAAAQSAAQHAAQTGQHADAALTALVGSSDSTPPPP